MTQKLALLQNCHKFDFDNVVVLERNIVNKQKRLTLESYHINKFKNNVNLQIESGYIDKIYSTIL